MFFHNQDDKVTAKVTPKKSNDEKFAEKSWLFQEKTNHHVGTEATSRFEATALCNAGITR